MKLKFYIFVIIFSLLFIPMADAQISVEDSKQKSVEVVIKTIGEVHVTHTIGSLKEPYQLDLIEGNASNLTVMDEEGKEKLFGVLDTDRIMIFPSEEDVIVQYDLSDALIMKDNVWTWDFLYLETTSFIFPDEIDLIYVDDKAVNLGDKKGINCHGCQMVLEFSPDEPKSIKKLEISGNEYLIEVRSWATINQFQFDKNLEGLSFQIMEENTFVTTIVPVDFLIGPYQVFLDGERIFFNEYYNNGTHSWLNMKPQNSGEVSIMGTIVPDISNSSFLDNKFSLEYIIAIVIIAGVIIGVVLLIMKRR